MKPIILKSHEVIHLRDTGSVIAWRVVKPQIGEGYAYAGCADAREYLGPKAFGKWGAYFGWKFTPCPYGRTREERWVKEAFSRDAVTMYPCPVAWYKASDHIESGSSHDCPKPRSVPYADCLACWEERYGKFRWRSPATMPRWASRFTVTLDVGLKRIQEVDAFTARSSGVVVSRCACEVCSNGSAICPADASEYALGMRTRVDVSNPGSWDRNDYFWKITCTLKK